jgi:hypothetical protein
VAAVILGWVAGRYELQENWASPERVEQLNIEIGELRKFIDSRCNGCTVRLATCEKECEELEEELNVRCKNVIKYAVQLEFENSRLNKLLDRCNCDRTSVPMH